MCEKKSEVPWIVYGPFAVSLGALMAVLILPAFMQWNNLLRELSTPGSAANQWAREVTTGRTLMNWTMWAVGVFVMSGFVAASAEFSRLPGTGVVRVLAGVLQAISGVALALAMPPLFWGAALVLLSGGL